MKVRLVAALSLTVAALAILLWPSDAHAWGPLAHLNFSAQTATSFVIDPVWDWFGSGKVAGIPFSFVTLIVVLLIGHIVLSRSRLGWHITAVGASRRAARHAGIRVFP